MSNTSFQKLNLNNAFLFPAALEDPEICRLVIECIIGEVVGELKVKTEYTKLYNSELKYIRLDVYARDVVTEISYNLEAQNKNEYNLPLRSRYYQAQIDMGSLKPGEEYTDLKPLYIVFICNFDPFDKELYRYTFSMQCEESSFPLDDGIKRIFFNTKGKNREEVPKILVDFLGYLNDSTDMYVEQDLDEKVKRIHERIKILKQNRNVEKNYMHYLSVEKIIKAKEMEAEEAKRNAEEAKKDAEEAKKDAEEAKKDAEEAKKDAEEAKKDAEEAIKIVKDIVLETVEKLDMLSEDINERIKNEKNVDILKSILDLAVKSDSVEQFEKQIANL